MIPIRVVPVGAVDRTLVDAVVAGLAHEYRVPCSATATPIDPARTLHPERRQYHSSEILADLSALELPCRVLGVAAVDLYIPILTFVFGEAQLEGMCAVVSYHRFEETFYGLPSDPWITEERLVKCAIHEVGHTYGLHHCEDYECVMASAHSVEWVDLKGSVLCTDCRLQMAAAEALAARGK
jgi:archaemetzincin